MILSEPGVVWSVTACVPLARLLRRLPPAELVALDQQVVGEVLAVADVAAPGNGPAALGKIVGSAPWEVPRSAHEVLSAGDVATRYDVPIRTVRHHARRGWLPGWQVGEGERWLFAADEAAVWAAERRVTREYASTADRGRADRPGAAAGDGWQPGRSRRDRGMGVRAG